ncbi:MAG: hypothetical protein HWN66_13620 [Candidatus Helarchaeota archaeon]|nr:hypothetical protein [Candidatus Helarchaeota archaeon]
MRKSKKVFLIVGLPLLLFMIFITIIYHVLNSLWFITIAVVMLLAMYRKERKYITLTKLAFVLFLWFVFLCWNPLHWPDQIYRRMNKGSLITPNAQCIADLNITFYSSSVFNGPYNRSTIQGQLDMLSDIQYFLYSPNYNDDDWINYTYDFFQYPGIFDHVPTPEEVLENRQDDCDGIAVVTVSLLVRLGYEAYVAESDSHWWTYVNIYGEDLNSSVRGKTHTVVYLNWWEEIGEPYLIFNQTAIILMQPLYVSWWDQMTESYYGELIQKYALEGDENLEPLLTTPIFIVILPFALLALGLIFSFGIGFPRKYPKARMYLANMLLASVSIAAILFTIVFLPSNLLILTNFLLLGGIGILAFVIERDYLTKWIWKPEK